MRGVQSFSLGDLLRENARRHPQRIAVVCEEDRISFPELRDRAYRAAALLRSLGVGEGDRVAWFAQNCHRYLEALFGTTLLGATFVPLNWRSTAAELTRLLGDAEPKLVVDQSREIGEVVAAARGGGAAGGATWIGIDDGGATGWDARLGAQAATDPGVDVDDEACAIRMYTAAFEGVPKGAQLTHRGVLSQNLSQIIALGLTAEDVYLNTGPLFHIAGTMFLHAHLHIGAKNVMLPRVEGEMVARLIQITASQCKIKPYLCLACLGIGITELTHKVSHIQPLAPGLGHIGAHGPRRAPDLVRQRISFILGPAFRQLKKLHGRLET